MPLACAVNLNTAELWTKRPAQVIAKLKWKCATEVFESTQILVLSSAAESQNTGYKYEQHSLPWQHAFTFSSCNSVLRKKYCFK